MGAARGSKFVPAMIEQALRAVPVYTAMLDSDTCWDHVRSGMLDGGVRPDDAAHQRLVEAAGFLALIGRLPGVCPDCGAVDLVDRAVLLPVDRPAFPQALGVAGALAAGVIMSTEPPQGVSSASWLRVSYAAAELAYGWFERGATSDAVDDLCA